MATYLSQFSQAEEVSKSIRKKSVYGLILYIPSNFIIDFGIAQWPPKHLKKEVCPLALLVSSWSDARFGFVGGQIEKGESVIDALNREYHEEIGLKLQFESDDYIFSCLHNNCISHFYVRVESNRDIFQSLLIHFHSNYCRDAYIEEVFSIMSIPLWIEGPEDISTVSWRNNVWGLPRYLTQAGGFLSPTLQNNFIVRDHFLLILLALDVINQDLMRRIFVLSDCLKEKSFVKLPSFDEYLNIPGVMDVMESSKSHKYYQIVNSLKSA